jgi:hypothetical protein
MTLRDLRKIYRGSYGDEKQPQQETLEWLDISFELVPVLTSRENNSREKRPKSRTQSDACHEQRDADDQQQCRCGENLRHPRFGDEAKGRTYKEPASDHDRSNRTSHDQRRRPARESLHPGRRVPRVAGTMCSY